MTLVSWLWAVLVSTCMGSSLAQTVTQPQWEVPGQEAETVTLDCTYTTSESDYYLFWYKQLPNGEMIFIIRQEAYKQQNATNNRYSVNFQKAAKSFGLRISASQLEDAGVYFCAYSARPSGSGDKLTFGSGTRLAVRPHIKNPDPAVYQLKGPKSNNISVCLYTDFQMNTTKDSEPAVFSLSRTVFNSNTTVLDMGALGSKSNGLVAWSKSTDFECQSTFQQEFYPNSGISCDAKLVEKSFETDMNLNLQNLSVMGFRIILLKMVGFNLLMTLRLWSS